MSTNFVTPQNIFVELDEIITQPVNRELLFLVPMVQVAWAHGIVSGREKRMVFDAAREDGIDVKDPLNDTLNEWLIYQPSRRFFDECLEQLRQILQEMTVKDRESAKSKLISRCTKVAGIAGDERLDTDGYISAEELQTLARIMDIINYRAQKPLAEMRKL